MGKAGKAKAGKAKAGKGGKGKNASKPKRKGGAGDGRSFGGSGGIVKHGHKKKEQGAGHLEHNSGHGSRKNQRLAWLAELSPPALALCRALNARLPAPAPDTRASRSLERSRVEILFVFFHAVLVHCAVHGFRIGSGAFGLYVFAASAVIIWFVRFAAAYLRAAADTDVIADGKPTESSIAGVAFAAALSTTHWPADEISEHLISLVVPIVAALASRVRASQEGSVTDNPFLRAPPGAPESDEIESGPSFAWLWLPVVLQIVVQVALACTGVSDPFQIFSQYGSALLSSSGTPSGSAPYYSTAVSPTRTTGSGSPGKASRAAATTLRDREFAAACLANHDANMQPSLIGACVRIVVRSFKWSFWVVLAPLVMQTWDPLYYNKTVCAMAFVSTWIGCTTIGAVDLIRVRLPRLMEAIRVQGYWEFCGGGDKGNAGADSDFKGEWDASVVYAVGDVVSVSRSGGSSKVAYRAAGMSAAAFGGGDSGGGGESTVGGVFSDPHTLNASVVRWVANDPSKSLGLARLIIFGVQAVWSMLLLLCCISSPFWFFYAGMIYGSMGVFYVGAEKELPLSALLSITSGKSVPER